MIDGKMEQTIEKGQEVSDLVAIDPEEAELELMEFAIKDIEVEEKKLIVTCEKNDFSTMQQELKDNNFHVLEGSLQFIAKDDLTMEGEELEKLQSLIEQLEDDDDVSEVFCDVGT